MGVVIYRVELNEEDSDDSDTDDKSIREKKQYPMYLDDDLRRKLNVLFLVHNARRASNDQPVVEKNKHFNQGLIECALDNDWEEYIKKRFEEISE